MACPTFNHSLKKKRCVRLKDLDMRDMKFDMSANFLSDPSGADLTIAFSSSSFISH